MGIESKTEKKVIEQSDWKGTEFYKSQLIKAGFENIIKYFDSISWGATPPKPDSGYPKEPTFSDINLDGKKTDIYCLVFGKNKEEFSIYLHIKE